LCCAHRARIHSGDNLGLSWAVSFVSLALGPLTLSGRCRILSSRATTIFTPLMVSRLMLSLKGAAAKTNTTNLNPGPSEGVHIQFAPWPPRGLLGVLGSLEPVSEGVELEPVSHMSRRARSQLLSPTPPKSRHPPPVRLYFPTLPDGAVANTTYSSRFAWNENPPGGNSVAR
jgi:hypothetical protein